MKTILLDDVESAAQVLRAGGLVAFPTETVFGLGADARNAVAIQRIFAAKGRPGDNPLIVHVADTRHWQLVARELTKVGQRVLELFAPGPVTVVLPKSESICALVTAGLDSVGLRIPAAELTRDLLRIAGIPIAAPSANRSGRPSGTTWQSVLEDLDGRIDAILCIDVPHVGLESSVIDCLGDEPVLLRPGAVGLADLQLHFPNARQAVPPSLLGDVQPPTRTLSPGLNHPHYQPRARVVLLEPDNGDDIRNWHPGENDKAKRIAYAGLKEGPRGMVLTEKFASVSDYAHGFYEFLRKADRAQVDVVLLEAIAVGAASSSGVAAALRDRQRRSAGMN